MSLDLAIVGQDGAPTKEVCSELFGAAQPLQVETGASIEGKVVQFTSALAGPVR